MQQNEFDAVFRHLSNGGDNAETRNAAARLRAALQTPEGRQAAQTILQSCGGSLENAARMAQAGDVDGAKKYVQQLMRTPEGARLAAQIQKAMGR
ncbi:MAG TPA: hypothetical protein DDX51_06755 [Clostridiales bacterium]|nr:hypothetical protein [Clostridiales bacterium]